MIDEMVTVTKEEFYAAMGPLNVHPCVYDPDVTNWEIVTTRKAVGRSYPGWRNNGLPESIQPRRFEILKNMVERQANA